MKKFRITFNSPVLLTFIFLCFLATLLGVLTGGNSTLVAFSTYRWPLTSPGTWLRFFTHVIGHSGWEHFIGNATYLLLLGPLLEEKHGSKNLILIILVTAFVTGIVNYIFFPSVALCGASGVVFAFIILASFTGFHEGEIPLTFLLVAIVFIGQQIYEGITITDDISNLSHILGGCVGAIIGYRFNLNRKPHMPGKKPAEPAPGPGPDEMPPM